MATPDWKGLFEWSMKYQDGTAPAGGVRQMTEDDRAWFEEAVKHYTVNVSQHLVQIKGELDSGGEESEEALKRKEDLLEELLEIVENIDNAKDLTSIGGLETLMGLLKDKHASLRWRAAEVAATCVQNNPPVQEWLLRAGCLPKLFKLLEDPDATCRQKGLLALSCLIRNNAAGTDAFVAEDGVDWLIRLLREDHPKVQRKALQLLGHIARATPHRLPSKTLLPLVIKAVQSNEAEIREAALTLLLRVATDPEILQAIKTDDGFVQQLGERRRKLSNLPSEEAELHREESDSICQILEAIGGGGSNRESVLTEHGGSVQERKEDKKPLLLLQ